MRAVEQGEVRTVHAPGAEGRAAALLAEAGAERVLLVCTARHRDGADRVAAQLGDRCVGVFAQAAPQVPRQVVDAAVAVAEQLDADWVLAHGGGTAVGLAKAVALRRAVRVAAIPTTYAGSEQTDIWGVSEDGRKTTGRDPRVRAQLVIYDPELLVALRPEVAVTSLFNAMAHSVEALYDAQADAEVHARAETSVGSILRGLEALHAAPDSVEAIAEAQHGAMLAGWVLSRAEMALHHKLAHVLGGSFGTPHAATHTALLPYTVAYHQDALPEAGRALSRALGHPDPAAKLFAVAERLGAPTRLSDLGVTLDEVGAVAAQTLEKAYANPVPVTAESLRRLLVSAVLGRAPSRAVAHLDLDGGDGAHAGLAVAHRGAPLERARAAVLVVHGRGVTAERMLERVAPDVLDPDVALLAPQAADRSWYPAGFLDVPAIEAGLTSAVSVLEAAWAQITRHVDPSRVVVVGFSQGACLALSWLSRTAARPRALVAWTGAPTPGWHGFRALEGTHVYLGTCRDDPWVGLPHVQAAARSLTEAGAQVALHVADGGEHAIRPADHLALTRLVETALSDDLSYQSGFGNALATEAREGALPLHQNGPRQVAYGLYAEQINGTGFTVHRPHNLRVWLYRLRPQILARPYERVDAGRFAGSFDQGVLSPNLLRYAPLAYPDAPTTFVQGVTTFAGAGDPALKAGMAIHLYAATADMVDQAFTSVDGDLLVVPQEGALHVRTELGRLHVRPGEILVLPRGIRFAVSLPDGRARGFFSELFDGHHQLPDRGLVGANGLADERHFHAPVADFEDREGPYEILVKQGGQLWRGEAAASPFDVVAWHGTYAPFKYDLMDFAAYWSVNVDHSDPSIHTVLTCPRDATGRNALDFAVFRGRWDPTEHTFRPPFFHRNAAIEFNAVLKNTTDEGPYRPGAFTYTPYLSPHGVSRAGYERAVGASDAEADAPRRGSDQELWIQWESTYPLKVMPWMLDHPGKDDGFLDQFQGFSPAKV